MFQKGGQHLVAVRSHRCVHQREIAYACHTDFCTAVQQCRYEGAFTALHCQHQRRRDVRSLGDQIRIASTLDQRSGNICASYHSGHLKRRDGPGIRIRTQLQQAARQIRCLPRRKVWRKVLTYVGIGQTVFESAQSHQHERQCVGRVWPCRFAVCPRHSQKQLSVQCDSRDLWWCKT